MIPAIKRYRACVAKHLPCCKETKDRLLESFDRNMLAPLLEEAEQPSLEDLCVALGTPKQTAALLMEQVTEEDAIRYQKRRKSIKTVTLSILSTLLAIILLFTIYVFFAKEKPLTYQDDKNIIDTFTYTDGDAT